MCVCMCACMHVDLEERKGNNKTNGAKCTKNLMDLGNNYMGDSCTLSATLK